MNGLKASLISLKNRVQGHLRRKCKNAGRGSSAMRKLFTIRRLATRSQYSNSGKQEVKLVSSATQTEEVDVPSEAVTHLPTNSSESVTPVSLPSTDLPPLSVCPRPPVMYMLRSPSLYSWDSCSTTVSTQSEEELNSWDSLSFIASILREEKELNSWDSCSSVALTQSKEELNSWDSCSSVALTQSKEELNSWDSCSSVASALSEEEHGISLQTGFDEDDKEGVECTDEEECAAIPSAGGNSVCSNNNLFPNTSSGIVADYTASEGDNNVDDDGSDFDSDSDFDGNSSMSGSMSDGAIQIIACGDAMEQSADEELEIQRVYRPVTQSSSSFGSKSELTLPPKMAQAHPILTDLHLVPPLRQRQSESGKNVLPTTPPLRSTSSYHNNSLRSRKSGSSHLRSTCSRPMCIPQAWLA